MVRKSRRLRRRFVMLFVSVICGVVYLYLSDYEETSIPTQSPKLGEEEADYYGEGIFYKRFTEQGRLQQALTSKSSEHYPEAQVSEFTLPVIQSTNEEGKTWQIEALTGNMKDQDNLVTFSQNVIVQPLNPEPGQHLLITTELLHYHTKEQLATSELPVTITSDSSVVTGVGMSLLVPNENLKLNQQVKTQYAPPSQP